MNFGDSRGGRVGKFLKSSMPLIDAEIRTRGRLMRNASSSSPLWRSSSKKSYERETSAFIFLHLKQMVHLFSKPLFDTASNFSKKPQREGERERERERDLGETFKLGSSCNKLSNRGKTSAKFLWSHHNRSPESW